ncbi:MAG: tRNA (adenosine(37)-N6)-threonylcarbamoyltransferase complex transferase subunit TsaD [Deltaproteobacteria bacterium]|nr:tRNA (adenosine(37)-N6)-threonylcarbamoyltransferase complex transferase subunit TsaD [Deltaproteobacteria bacterium]MBW2395077.1 tRNA (adenosine(37)-N6)-threonylcarbamoyltransferase complex transferase subunit TsaD [Deltaproteobacteria bacterium]
MTGGLVLGVESSCDEMAAAVVRASAGKTEVLASVVEGQAQVHRPYGGVVPELASRDHLRSVSAVADAALRKAGIDVTDLAGVAVTAGPGLLGSLLVGLSFGKALAYRHGLPCVGVHHLAGHLAAAELCEPDLQVPYIGLVVSGGHTALYRVVAEGPPEILGETRDDAVGEAFDKVAKLLGLEYPGGPAVARVAENGNAAAIALPRPMLHDPNLDFSYSGLKTAVSLAVQEREPLSEAERSDLAASFEAAATDVLVAKARRAVAEQGASHLAVVGGVAANQRLRAVMGRAGDEDGFRVVFPSPELCTDNAAMIAAAGARLLAQGERHGLELSAFSRVPLSQRPWS